MVHETLKYLLTWVLGLTTSGLGVLCTVLVKRIKAQRKGLLALLHDRMYQSCRYYLAKGKVDVDGLKNLEYVYGSYHELGGNGTGTELYKKVKALPVEDD